MEIDLSGARIDGPVLAPEYRSDRVRGVGTPRPIRLRDIHYQVRQHQVLTATHEFPDNIGRNRKGRPARGPQRVIFHAWPRPEPMGK